MARFLLVFLAGTDSLADAAAGLFFRMGAGRAWRQQVPAARGYAQSPRGPHPTHGTAIIRRPSSLQTASRKRSGKESSLRTSAALDCFARSAFAMTKEQS